MRQSNALRRLDTILAEAVASGDPNHSSGPIILKAMGLSGQPRNIVDFYELLNKAEEEARSIKNKPKIDRYFEKIEELHQLFIVNHLWNEKWGTFANQIKKTGVLIALDALAEFYYSQNPKIFLEQDFISSLKNNLESLLDEIINSDLSRDLKEFLIERIEEILKAIRRYNLDGTEGLEQVTKSLISELAMKEHNFAAEDKRNPIYKRVQAFALGIILWITPSPYDIIGAAPDIQDFWIPKFEELTEEHKKIEEAISETSTIQEAFEKVSSLVNKQNKKLLPGKTIKALPASKGNLKHTSDNKNDS